MDAFDHLLSVLQPRVVEWKDVSPFGHTARLDDAVYFQVGRIPSFFIWNNCVQLEFLAFPAMDGSLTTPALPAVSRVSCVWWGMHVHPRGGILDTREGRANLRRVEKALHAGTANMATYEAEPSAKYLVTTWESHHLEPDDPRRWVKASFMILPKLFGGANPYDWSDLGERILQNLDDIRRTLSEAAAR